MGGYFAESRDVVLFWKLPEKGADDILLEWILERTWDVCKRYEYSPTDRGCQCVVLVYLAIVAGLHWNLLTLVFSVDTVAMICLAFFTDHHLSSLPREKSTKEQVVFRLLAISKDLGQVTEP